VTAVACPFCGAEHTAGTYVCPVTNRRLQGLLPVNTTIDDKYRIDGIIGVGGMGVVYRAEHTKIGRQVALKMLLPEYIVYPDLVARVEREARTAGQIDHPNVVSIVDLGSTNEYGPYIAMELLRGQELATTVEKAGGRLDAAEAVDIMRQVLAGLEAAHRKNVIHRDLKPENIFLAQQEDGNRTVKVLDFGISKLRDDSQLSSLTRTGTVMGTPQFMAPEQAAGTRDQDSRIDLYAAGAVLYAVLCNGLPYEAENYNLLINEILNKPPIPILSRNPTVDPRLAAIVMRAIAKKPDQRYQSARAMAEALTQWYDNRNNPVSPALKAQLSGPVKARVTGPARAAAAPATLDVATYDNRRTNPLLGPGEREVGRHERPRAAVYVEPAAFETFDNLAADVDAMEVEPGEATEVVPTFSGDELEEEPPPNLGATLVDPGAVGDVIELNPRASGSRNSAASSTGTPPETSVPLPDLLKESPLDAPPIVIPQKPKPPPDDKVWARLRTDQPSDPPDYLLDASPPPPRKRWPYALVAVLVALVAASFAFYKLAPQRIPFAIRRYLPTEASPTPPPAPTPTPPITFHDADAGRAAPPIRLVGPATADAAAGAPDATAESPAANTSDGGTADVEVVSDAAPLNGRRHRARASRHH
jgi:serine/threonine-protein kinase